ncbi:MAG: helix-turn-helix domain-containing protein [Panacagrimonas sp.]
MVNGVPTSSRARTKVGERLREARRLIESDYDTPWTLHRLARRVRLPRFAFPGAYFLAYGETPLDHLRRVRAHAAACLLLTARTPADVALRVGYTTERLFYSDYRRIFRADPDRLSRLER